MTVSDGGTCQFTVFLFLGMSIVQYDHIVFCVEPSNIVAGEIVRN